ncbi:hypothetical protein RRG08_056961 [Elysia crispata]|uniref:C2H2-type domain-containing protein n=1 Tax=Elysia crispata TaxID=231223 RepID=A0AAE1CT09_9GAST|nr:hypothetical protein RRG08_056961 [Elysia crispata]
MLPSLCDVFLAKRYLLHTHTRELGARAQTTTRVDRSHRHVAQLVRSVSRQALSSSHTHAGTRSARANYDSSRQVAPPCCPACAKRFSPSVIFFTHTRELGARAQTTTRVDSSSF